MQPEPSAPVQPGVLLAASCSPPPARRACERLWAFECDAVTRADDSLNVALLRVHYLLVLFNDNQMQGLITAAVTAEGRGGGEGAEGQPRALCVSVCACAVVYGRR